MSGAAMRRGWGAAAVVAVAAVTSASQCGPDAPPPDPQRTFLSGSVRNRTFADSTAAFAEETTAGVRTLVVRVAMRPDTCTASSDPTDPLDPSLLIAISPDQVGTFPVLGQGSGARDRFATATLFTFTDMPDGGVPEGVDAGLRPVVMTATGGEVVVTDYNPGVEEGRLNARVTLIFADGGGYVGQVGAWGCQRVR